MVRWWQPPRLRISETAQRERHATWLEVFYDLVFVVAVTELGNGLNAEISAPNIIQFVSLFIPVWWSWIGAAYYATRFDTDDAGHRLLTLAQMFAVGAMAINVPAGLGATSSGFALSYAAVRFLLVAEYIRAGRNIPEARPLTKRYYRGFGVAAIVWLISAFVPITARFYLWGLGMAIDFATPLFAGQLHAQLPPHSAHLPERFGLFTIIVLGAAVAGTLRGLSGQHWNMASAVAAGLGLGIAFSIWWIYFDSISGAAIQTARSTGRTNIYQSWIYAHLPLAIAITAAAAGLQHAVLQAQGPPLQAGTNWLVCGALIIIFLALTIIHISTVCVSVNARLYNEAGARYRIIAAIAIAVTGIIGARLIPIALIALLCIICSIQVILDVYERQYHSPES